MDPVNGDRFLICRLEPWGSVMSIGPESWSDPQVIEHKPSFWNRPRLFIGACLVVVAVIDCTQEIMSLYEIWDAFGGAVEKSCKDQLTKMIKQRAL